MKKKALALVMTVTMMAGGLVGCGNGDKADLGKAESSDGEGNTGSYVYERTVLNQDEVEATSYNFGKGSISSKMRALRVELNLEDDSTFALDVHGWMQEDTEGSDHKIGDAFEYGEGMYAEYFANASGSYEQEGNQITISVTDATYEIPDLGVSYLAQMFTGNNAGGGSYNPEGDAYYGEWNSKDVPQVLEQFPDTVFTVDGDTIVTWEKTGRLTEVNGENANITFYDDGTGYYEDTENSMAADMTWKLEGENIVLTYSGVEGKESTTTGNVATPLKITLRQYTDSVSFNDYTQSIQLSSDNIAALQ